VDDLGPPTVVTVSSPPAVTSGPPPPTGRAGNGALPAALLLGAVGLAFADASVVALALPDLYSAFGTSIAAVSWVLTAYALAVAVAGSGLVPVARRLRPSTVTTAGAVVFAAASTAAALAPSLGVLLAARAVQGVGAAGVVTGSLGVLATLLGDEHARRRWAAAGTIGAAVGPALGGLVTQLWDWRMVFALQAPLALGAVVAARMATRRDVTRPTALPTGRRDAGSATADVALGLTFGALVGALFLGVILLVVVWGEEPIVAAAIVTTLPAGTLVAMRCSRRLGARGAVVAGGAALAGGLATLALLPSVSRTWAGAALATCGIGLGLLVGPLGALSVRGTDARAATLSSAARHLGLVLGLVLIAPVLAADIGAAAKAAPLPATAAILDAKVGAIAKVRLALDIRDLVVDAPTGEVPNLEPAFARNGAARDPGMAELQADLERGIHEILTRAFRTAFLLAALLAGLAGAAALLAVQRATGARPDGARRRAGPIALAVGITAGSIVLPVGATAAGAEDIGRFVPVDACHAPVDPYDGAGFDAALQRFVLSGLYGAACELGVTREELVLSLEPTSGVPVRWDNETIERALRAGTVGAIEAADGRDSLPGWLAWSLQQVVERAPVRWFLDRLLG
jgi:predicted MFS family arabinose efflux permease